MAKADKNSTNLEAKKILNDGTLESFSLEPKLFGVTPNMSVLAQYLRVFAFNNRQGTASSKDRSQIIGTTKKMYKQKGTGNARHASAKAPIFVGGGVVGGPKPRDYSLKISKNQKKIAFSSALSNKAQDGVVYVFDTKIAEIEPKTKNMNSLIKKSAIKPSSVSIVTDSQDANIVRSVANLKNVKTLNVVELNPFVILKSKTLIFTHNAYSKLLSLHK